MRAALRLASGLLAFHAWLGTQDLKDEHVMVRPRTGRKEYELASIDFASAFNWSDASGGNVALPTGPTILIANRDPRVLDRVLGRIERLEDARIRDTIHLLPDVILQQAEKGRIVNGLSARKILVRPVLQQAGWLVTPGASPNAQP